MMLSTNRSYRIRIFDISLVLFAICLHCNAAILISAIEGNGLEFNPPSEWQAIQSGNATGKKTTKLGTNVTFTFQGKASSIAVYANWTQFKANVSASINDSGIPFLEPKQGMADQPVKIFERAELSPDKTHTIRLSRRNGAKEEKPWNILYINLDNGTSSTTSEILQETKKTTVTSPSPGIGSHATSPASTSAALSTSKPKSSSGLIAGAVIGTLFGVFFIVAISFMLYRYRLRSSTLAPDPLMIGTTRLPTPPPPYHNERRMPRFTAPPSIWPPSTRRSSFTAFVRPSFPEDRLPSKITPFTLQTPVTMSKLSPPPKPQTLGKANRSFFVANQASHSSRSDTSDRRGRLRDSAPPILSPASDAREKDAVIGVEEYTAEKRAVEKGKRRALDFEIEPLSERPRKTRKSIRRRFFTTNPNPSTVSSSSSASVSSRRSKSLRRAAKFVREQAGFKSSARQLPRAASARPTGASSRRPLPPAPLPHRPLPIPKDGALAQTQPLTKPPPPRRKRVDQTVLYTTNPSAITSSSGPSETRSPLSETPRPRLDKGKGRAF